MIETYFYVRTHGPLEADNAAFRNLEVRFPYRFTYPGWQNNNTFGDPRRVDAFWLGERTAFNDGTLFRVRMEPLRLCGQAVAESLQRFSAWVVLQPGVGFLESAPNGALARERRLFDGKPFAQILASGEPDDLRPHSRPAWVREAMKAAVSPVEFDGGFLLLCPTEKPARLIRNICQRALAGVDWAIIDHQGVEEASCGVEWEAVFLNELEFALPDEDE